MPEFFNTDRQRILRPSTAITSPFDQDEDELFGGVSYAFPWFTVAFTAYGEVIHTVDEWFQLDLTKSIPVDCLCKGATLDLGASFGYLILNHDNNLLSLAGNTGTYSDFHTCQLTADIKFPINKYVSISPKVGLLAAVNGLRLRLPASQLAGL